LHNSAYPLAQLIGMKVTFIVERKNNECVVHSTDE